jgi:hypothetical protein
MSTHGEGHLEGRSYEHSRLVEVTIPQTLLDEIWARAEAQDIDRGGRYRIEGDSILIWPSPTRTGGHHMGSVTFHRNAPEPGFAWIYDIHWNPAHGGSEPAVLEAANELIGSELL